MNKHTHLYYLYTIDILFVHYWYTICILFVYYLYTICITTIVLYLSGVFCKPLGDQLLENAKEEHHIHVIVNGHLPLSKHLLSDIIQHTIKI